MRLAESIGVHSVVAQKVHLPGDVGSNPAGKVASRAMSVDVTVLVAGRLSGDERVGGEHAGKIHH
jgi:hypothetical protein